MKLIRYSAVVILALVALWANVWAGFTLIPQDKFSRAAAMLDSAAGTAYSGKNIVSMGFEKDSSACKLVVVTFDTSGNPRKETFPVNKTFYNALMGETAPAVEQIGAKSDSVVPGKGQNPQSAEQKPAVALQKRNQDGRVYFMLMTSLVKVPYVIPVNLANAIPDIPGNVLTGVTLLSMGGSMYGLYEYTAHMNLGWGRVGLMDYYSWLGIAYPGLLSIFLDRLIDGDQKNDFPALKVNAILTLIGFPLGIYLGSRSQVYGDMEQGNVDILSYFSLYSALLYGFSLPALLPDEVVRDHYLDVSSGLAMALIPAGNMLARKIIGTRDFSSGRGLFIQSTGLLGAATGIVLPGMFGLWDNSSGMNAYAIARVSVLTGIAGHVLGTWFGFDYHKELAYSYLQSAFIDGSAFAGYAVGTALPLLVNSSDYKPFLVTGTLGMWGGLIAGEYLSRSIFEESPQDKRSAKISVSFPGLSTLPLLALTQFAARAGKTPEHFEVPYIPIVNIAF